MEAAKLPFFFVITLLDLTVLRLALDAVLCCSTSEFATSGAVSSADVAFCSAHG